MRKKRRGRIHHSLLNAKINRRAPMPGPFSSRDFGLLFHRDRHLWYRMRGGVHYGNKVKIRGKPLDLRCEGAYAVVPGRGTRRECRTGGLATCSPLVSCP
jgi:hypothetical protein